MPSLPASTIILLQPFAALFDARAWRKAQVLLGLLLRHLAPVTGPLVLGIDETEERQKGQRIAAKGVYRDVLAFMRQALWRRTPFFACRRSRPTAKNWRSGRRPRLWTPFATLRDCTKSS